MIIHSIDEPLFSRYGRVLNFDGKEELFNALETIPVPQDGNIYKASCDILERCSIMPRIKQSVFGEMDIEAGYCNGNSFLLNALEYHKCPEVNFTTTGLVLLLALPEQLNDGCIDSSEVVAFRIPPNTLIEIFPLVLHFAPCKTTLSGFKCLVVLSSGTNMPLENTDLASDGEDKLLWMKNKWLTCHKDSPQAKKGAFKGISGENLDMSFLFY